MPLAKGKNNIGKNIKKLQGEGRKKDQALAIALQMNGIAGNKKPKAKKKK